MTITMYGKLGELIARELAWEVPREGISVALLRQALADRHPGAREDLLSPRLRACVGDAVVSDAHRVADGDAVELLPPVSGG